MSVTSGFFNSVNHDRLYDAEQISSMFDGIIYDGIYSGIGDAFIVKPYSDLNNTITVGTGRAWFDHTWTKNDTELAITLDDPNVLYDRIDCVVIDVDRRQDVRKNSIKVVKGEVSESGAVKPTLINEELHKQYPLSYITVKAGSPAPISASNMENVIGQSATPLVQAVLDHMDLTMFVQQMESEFNEWFERLKDTIDENTVATINNKLLELQDFDDSIKNSIINPEGYAASKNVTITTTALCDSCSALGLKSFSIMLSDGYIFSLSSKKNSTPYVMSEYSHFYWYVLTSKIYNLDGVAVHTYDSNKSINASNTGYIPTLSLLKMNDSYPYNLYFAIGVTGASDSSSFTYDYSNIYPACVKITITSNHEVSYDYSVGSEVPSVIMDYWNENPNNPANNRRNYTYGGLGAPTSAELEDGSFISLVGGRYTSQDTTMRVVLYKISSDGIVTSQGAIQNSSSYMTQDSNGSSNGEYTLLFDIYHSVNDPSYVGLSEYLLQYWGGTSGTTYPNAVEFEKAKISDLTLDKNTTVNSTNFTKVPYSFEDIYTKNLYYAINSSGDFLFKRNDSLTNYEKLKDVPPFIDFSTSLAGDQSIGQYTAGICSSDLKLIISGHGNQLRVGFAGDGVGFMSFSELSQSQALSTQERVDSLKLYKTNQQYISNDLKTYKFLIPGYMTNNQKFIHFPVPIGNSKSKTIHKTYVITVKIGD